jgi:hypothetical protein
LAPPAGQTRRSPGVDVRACLAKPRTVNTSVLVSAARGGVVPLSTCEAASSTRTRALRIGSSPDRRRKSPPVRKSGACANMGATPRVVVEPCDALGRSAAWKGASDERVGWKILDSMSDNVCGDLQCALDRRFVHDCKRQYVHARGHTRRMTVDTIHDETLGGSASDVDLPGYPTANRYGHSCIMSWHWQENKNNPDGRNSCEGSFCNCV